MVAIQNDVIDMDLQARIRELAPLIVSLRDQTEQLRLPAAPIVEKLRALRLCRMALDQDMHGHALPLDAALDACEQLAHAEASVGWIVWNNALPCLMSRFLEPAARAMVFGVADWMYACSTRPTGRARPDGDGYRVDGRWTIVSGCQLAEWLMLMCVVENGDAPTASDGAPEQRFVFVRREDCEIVDTWQVGGLRGTGSHDVVVRDLPVPRALTFPRGIPGMLDTPHGRLPIVCSMAAMHGAMALGIARLALETITALARTKLPPDGGAALGENPSLLAAIVRHGTALEAARSLLHERACQLWRTAAAGRPRSLDEMTAVWGAAQHAAGVSQEVVSVMYGLGGIDSLYCTSPLERAHRDVHAMRRHIIAQAFWLEDAGRVMLGASPRHPLYAV